MARGNHRCGLPPPPLPLPLTPCGISLQEAREGGPVSDRKELRARHPRGRRPLPVAEEGAEQADDWRVPGQQTEAVQQGRAGVSHLQLTS